MTKTKAQLRAEAVERLKDCRYHTLADYVRAMLGWGHEPHFEDSRDALVDLLTDECGPCYSCAKLAELRAENNALREIVGDLKVPTDSGEAAMMSVDAFIEKQTEHESRDSREKLEEDARALQERIWRAGANSDGISLSNIIELLDRQAAITERHILTQPDERDEQIAELYEDVAERDDVIAVLKAENAELQSRHCEWSDPKEALE